MVSVERISFMTESIPLTIDLVVRVIYVLKEAGFISDELFALSNVIDGTLWSFYPLLQAYGMLRLKDTSDPISGISSLKGIMIISQNQLILSSYKENIQQDGQFKKLKEED